MTVIQHYAIRSFAYLLALAVLLTICGVALRHVWGLVFQVEENANRTNAQEDIVRGRIWQLVYYLQSIQEK